ncbi:hypothetical protein BN946_scf184983.g62 [Trametes cinnabarina]|uniref:Uncharacterized protein n=1 Tax=Pycnoporus cinnabarinus TaxID=5643 RepID=A0A060SK16_PYCCI|nr:hypothetical protein BN946_scf184983.g62 [Trametes cinnabarina]
MDSAPSSFSYHSALDRFSAFDECESALSALPPSINAVSPDIDCDTQSPDATDRSPAEQSADAQGRRRRSSFSHLNIGTLSLCEPAPIDEGEDEDVPLVRSSSPTKAAASKARRKIGALFQRLHRRKPSKVPRHAVRATLGSVVPDEHSEDPFGDEHAMDWEDDEAGFEGAGTSGQASPGVAPAPKTPGRGRCTSAPTTPGASPWSTKSGRSSTSWQRSPKTPRSAKSWLSDSSPGSLSITGSVTSSLRRKHVRRRQRQMASQMKSMQILGSEAGAAIAKAANVKESKLRYREFDRKMRDQLKRVL